MKFGPIIAVVFAFFIIAVYPYYVNDDLPLVNLSDDDGDGVTNDKDQCPEEDASLKDLDKDGCLDSEITKEEIDYLEKIAKFNLGQYVVFAVLSLITTVVFLERENIKLIFTSEEEPTSMKNFGDTDKEAENVDYETLGEVKDYSADGTAYGAVRIREIASNLWKEADINIQIISTLCILCCLFAPTTSWLSVTGEESIEFNEGNQSTKVNFEAEHYIDHVEYSADGEGSESRSYESQSCTEEIDEFHNCNYRTSLFQTIDTMLNVIIILCFVTFLLSFRIENYRIPVSIIFCLALVTTMGMLLLFTSLIDNALISDEVLIDSEQKETAGCWMVNPIIWGDGSCLQLIENGDVVVNENVEYMPGLAFFIVLASTSLLFVGLFTDVYPLLNQRKTTWAEAMRENWQVFAIIGIIIFLWRVNLIVSNI